MVIVHQQFDLLLFYIIGVNLPLKDSMGKCSYLNLVGLDKISQYVSLFLSL